MEKKCTPHRHGMKNESGGRRLCKQLNYTSEWFKVTFQVLESLPHANLQIRDKLMQIIRVSET